MSRTTEYVIQHQNVISLRDFELRDYIKELRQRVKYHGRESTEELEEWLIEAINEREIRKQAKCYKPGVKEKDAWEQFIKNRAEGNYEKAVIIIYDAQRDTDTNEEFRYTTDQIDEITKTIEPLVSSIEELNDIIEWIYNGELNDIYYLDNGSIEIYNEVAGNMFN